MTLQWKMHMIDATLIIYNMSREFGQSHLHNDKMVFGQCYVKNLVKYGLLKREIIVIDY